MNTSQRLQQTIDDLVDDRRGILAADESEGTIKKRFDAEGVSIPFPQRDVHLYKEEA